MIPSTHFDHRASVWRFQERESATLRVKERQWGPVAGSDDVPVALQAQRQTWEDRPGGQKVGGEWKAFAHADMDVLEGDVLEVYEGPLAPMNLEVDSAYPPRSHHMELVLIPWDGSLA